MTGTVRVKAHAGQDHGKIQARVVGCIKYGKKHKEAKTKDEGFTFETVLDTCVVLAEPGK